MATKYLTAGHSNSPYITTYSQNGSSFTKLSNPSTLPVDNVYAVHWNYNATSLAVATFATSPYVIVYNVALDVFTKIAEFTELSGSLAVAWSPDGSKLVLGDIASPYIRIYNRSGDTFTQVSDPGTLPTGAAQGLSWSPDGNKLAVAHSSSPFVTVYQVSGDTFTKVSDPGTLPHGSGYAVAWNPTSDVLAVGGEGTSSIYPGRVYNYSSNTLSYVSTIGSPATGVLIQRDGLAWRPNGNQLAMMSNQANVIYNKSGDTYTSSGANITLAGTAGPVEWDNFGNTIAIGHTSSPYISIYNQVSDSGFVKFANPGTLPTGLVRSLTWTFATNTQSGNLSVSSAFITTGLANRSSSAGVVVLSSVSVTALLGYLKTATANISTVTSTVLSADVLAEGYADAYFDSDYVAAGYVVRPRLGQAALTSTSTVSASVSTNKPASATLLAFNTVLSAGSRLASGVDIVAGSFSLAATAYDFTKATASLTSAVTVSAAAYDFTKATASLTSAVTSTTVGVKVFGVQSALTSTASVSAVAVFIRGAAIALTAVNSLISEVGLIRPGDAVLTAFNTVVSAGGRIRPAVDISGLAFTLAATPYNFTKASASLTNAFTVAPNGGKIFGGILQGSSPIPYPTLKWDADYYGEIDSVGYVTQDPLGGGTGGKVFSFWADARDGGGVVVSSPAGVPITIYEDSEYFDIRLEDGQLSMTMVTTTRSWYVPTTGWHHYLINMQFPAGEIKAYVDGVEAPKNLTAGGMAALIGNRIRIYDTFNGSIAQFWLGKTVINELTYWYNNGFVDMGVTGITDTQTTGPIEYMPYQTVYYYDRLGLPPDLTGVVKRDVVTGGNIDWNQVEYYGVWGPEDIYVNLPTIVASLIATGDNIVGAAPFTLTAILTLTANIRYVIKAAAALTSSATVTARLSEVIPSSASLTSQATLTAVTYEFTKAAAAITAAFTLSANPDEISGGLALSLGSFSLTPAGNVIRDARTSVASAVTLTANAADKNMGEAVLFTAFTLEAIPRVTFPIRPEAMTMSAAFSVSPTSNRFRDSQVPLASAWTFANGVTRAIRSGVVTMSAFDTVLSAGKIIEFLAENTIVVTEEQRRLRVALESTVLLVQMANGVNTITAETTDIVVPQEQGVLLARYNMPTN